MIKRNFGSARPRGNRTCPGFGAKARYRLTIDYSRWDCVTIQRCKYPTVAVDGIRGRSPPPCDALLTHDDHHEHKSHVRVRYMGEVHIRVNTAVDDVYLAVLDRRPMTNKPWTRSNQQGPFASLSHSPMGNLPEDRPPRQAGRREVALQRRWTAQEPRKNH